VDFNPWWFEARSIFASVFSWNLTLRVDLVVRGSRGVGGDRGQIINFLSCRYCHVNKSGMS
jgi:hypothetical protein